MIWTLEINRGKGEHQRKIKGSKSLPCPHPRVRKTSRASGAGQHEGTEVGGRRVRIEVRMGRGQSLPRAAGEQAALGRQAAQAGR